MDFSLNFFLLCYYKSNLKYYELFLNTENFQ